MKYFAPKILLSSNETLGLFLIIGGSIIVIAILILLYKFVFSRNVIKRQVRELEKRYTYYDSLLIGQDSQYIHRLDIISHTNLLYVEKHEIFTARFKEIFDSDDKFAEEMIKQLKNLIANNQYKNIKSVINDAKNALEIFEDKVNKLNDDLYAVIKPEEDSRQSILKLKEKYRHIKQIFYSNSNDLDLVSGSFIKVFDKLDSKFSDFENCIESAEYDEAQNLIPVIGKVVNALETALNQLPNLCIMSTSLIPERIKELSNKYYEIEKSGVPLFNLNFRNKLSGWNMHLEEIKRELIGLKSSGIKEELEEIQKDVELFNEALEKEIENKEYFETHLNEIYNGSIQLGKVFLKICAIRPDLEKIYIIEEERKQQLEELRLNINKLSDSQRMLDNFIHAATKEPYSILKNKLDELENNYSAAKVGIDEFKLYIDFLKASAQEAYNLVFAYYYSLRRVEFSLREMFLPDYTEQFKMKIDSCYEMLNDIDKTVKKTPIDIKELNSKVDLFKSTANSLINDVDNHVREMQLAESAVVYANRDRYHQTDVAQQLDILETAFFKGDFLRVYHEAGAIFNRMHIDTAQDVK